MKAGPYLQVDGLKGPWLSAPGNAPLRLGSSQQGDVVHQAAQIAVRQAQLNRTGEVHQGLHYAIEALDLVADYVHVAASIRVGLLQLLPQHLQMDDDGVDGVLDFVGHARGQAANGGQAA